MDGHIVKILKSDFVNHNVKHIVVEKPEGLRFISGQAADISINVPGFEKELRPFTFTSVNNSENLEFVIKIYKGHNGITEKLAELRPGDELIVHDVFGSIRYKGPGLFIAGGAGITPFISIFRQLQLENKLAANTLLFANRTDHDVILRDELKEKLSPNYFDIIEKPAGNGGGGKLIDKELLKKHVNPQNEYYYICGPDKFIKIMVDNLIELGVSDHQIVIEH